MQGEYWNHINDAKALQIGMAIKALTTMPICFINKKIQDEPIILDCLCILTESQEVLRFKYNPHIAPCQDVWEKGSYCVPSKVCELYPEDKGLVQVKAESYLGATFAENQYQLGLLSKQKINDDFDYPNKMNSSIDFVIEELKIN